MEDDDLDLDALIPVASTTPSNSSSQFSNLLVKERGVVHLRDSVRLAKPTKAADASSSHSNSSSSSASRESDSKTVTTAPDLLTKLGKSTVAPSLNPTTLKKKAQKAVCKHCGLV